MELENTNTAVIDDFMHDDSPTKNYDYASFWIRLGAYFIDCLVMVLPVIGLQYLILGSTWGDPSIYDQVINIGMWWMYTAFTESSEWQGTVGKKALRIMVVDEEGERISFGRATGRYFAMFISILIIIGILMIGFDKRKQGLHDKMAGCLHIMKRVNKI